jgi:hypothetical protein
VTSSPSFRTLHGRFRSHPHGEPRVVRGRGATLEGVRPSNSGLTRARGYQRLGRAANSYAASRAVLGLRRRDGGLWVLWSFVHSRFGACSRSGCFLGARIRSRLRPRSASAARNARNQVAGAGTAPRVRAWLPHDATPALIGVANASLSGAVSSAKVSMSQGAARSATNSISCFSVSSSWPPWSDATRRPSAK